MSVGRVTVLHILAVADDLETCELLNSTQPEIRTQELHVQSIVVVAVLKCVQEC